MKNYDQFVTEAINYGVVNDDRNVWVVVDDIELEITVKEVLGRREISAFESSYRLENDTTDQAWEALYDQYKAVMEGGVNKSTVST